VTDAELVARVHAGDREAYGTLVQRHQHELYRHGRGMGLDHDTALDVVQDTFVRGYARLSDCRDPAHVRAWLFRILRNLCLDYLKNLRSSVISIDDVTIDVDNSAARSASAEERVTLNDALSRLPVSLREAFLLKHDSGYSYEEIADMTGAGASAVKMRVHRARETLRGMLMERAAVRM
jgi:RNA polymerase sigma-70 factor, ECF subfamily